MQIASDLEQSARLIGYEHTNTTRRAPTTGRKSWHKRAVPLPVPDRAQGDVSMGGCQSGAAERRAADSADGLSGQLAVYLA